MATFFTKGGFKKEAVLTKQFISTLKPVGLMFPKIIKKKKTHLEAVKAYQKKQHSKLHKITKHPKKQATRLNLPKEKTRWQLIKILDGMVSSHILVKVCKGKCMRCGKQHTQYENKKGEMKWDNYGCSHFWPRDYMGARFEEDNLDGLCWLPCHSQKWEKSKQGDYKDYMLKKLGKKGYEKLEIKARSITKFSTQEIKFMIDNFDKIWK